MTVCSARPLYVALVHHPVIDKNGEVIASAVTNLDLHDIARACRTYGVKGYYIITPLEDQRVLVQRILDHWVTGYGGTYNPKRRQALQLVRIEPTFGDMIRSLTAELGSRPQTVVTSARRSGNLTCRRLREMLDRSTPVVLAFGTAWGLSDAFMDAADFILEPLAGVGDYNHLSVRSAVSIMLDRLLGKAD